MILNFLLDLKITYEKLWFYDVNMERKVEDGEFVIFVGGSSDSLISKTFSFKN
ncbi:MAG: hypothetical protein K9G34_06425 [Melioribacteraceae bacterium]|nr:hypothetical protein [Melioribacteraceae bacterium]